MEKDKDKAELYIEYLEDNVRELVVNFSENDSELSAALVQKGEIIVKTKLYLSIIILFFSRLFPAGSS